MYHKTPGTCFNELIWKPYPGKLNGYRENIFRNASVWALSYSSSFKKRLEFEIEDGRSYPPPLQIGSSIPIFTDIYLYLYV